MQNVREQISANQVKTWIVLIIFSAIVAAIGWLFAYLIGFKGSSFGYFGFSLLFVGISNFVTYFFSDKIVLKMTGAIFIDEKQSPEIYKSVHYLVQAAKIPTPKIYIINDPTPNAFATGRDPAHASIALHKGLIEKLTQKEIEGVIAHELSHVKNFDTRLMAIVAMLAGILSILSDLFRFQTFFGGRNDEDNRPSPILMGIALVAAIIAPIAAILVQLAISRRREFLADATAAYLTHSPENLAQALLKISATTIPSPTAHAGIAHLYISSPFGKKSGLGILKLFMTHPPVEERVKALRSLRV